MDLDDFKPVNDTWGHAAGDEVLQELGRRLSAAVRETDLGARPGGGEFAFLLEGLSHADAALYEIKADKGARTDWWRLWRPPA